MHLLPFTNSLLDSHYPRRSPADNVARLSDAELNRFGVTAPIGELEIVTANTSTGATAAIDLAGSVTLLDGQVPELLLNATGGGISNTGAGSSATLTVTTLGLRAAGTGGTIGTSSNRMLVDTGNDTLAAIADSDIFITESDGATVGTATVNGVTVTGITTAGTGSASIDLRVTNGTLTVNEQIAAATTTTTNDVRIDVNGADDDDDIVLQTNGNVSAPDQVELRASRSITQALGTLLITADDLALIAGQNIGTASGNDAIDTNVTTLAASAGNATAGSIFIREATAGAGLTVGQVAAGLSGTPTVTGAVANTADGTVDIRTLDGAITVTQVVTAVGAGNVILDAADDGNNATHDIDIQANVTAVEASGGDVHLRADNAITRTTGAGTISGDSVYFEAGAGVGSSANVLVTSAATLGVNADSSVFIDEAAAGTNLGIGLVQDLIGSTTFDGISTSTDTVTVRLLADGGTLTVTDTLGADTIRTSGANVTLVADEMTFATGGGQRAVNSGAAIVVLKSFNNEAIDLGSTATAVNDVLELSAAELSEISAAGGSIVIGSDADATNVTATSISLSTDVDFTTSNVLLAATGNITSTNSANEVNVNNGTSGGGSLTFQAGGSIGAAGTAFGLEVATVSALAGNTDDLINIADIAGNLSVDRVTIGSTNFDDVTASDTIKIVASGGDLSTVATNGQISTDGNNDKITLTSNDGAVTISGSVTSDGGEIEVNADAGITLDNADADIVSFVTTANGGQGVAGLIDLNADVDGNGTGTFAISDAGATLSTDTDTDANVDISGGDFNLTADATIDAGSGTLLIAPSAAKAVEIGTGDANFGIHNNEINYVDEASSLVIGQTGGLTTASSLTIDGTFNLSTITTAPGNVTLITTGAISNDSGTLTMPASADLLLLAGTGIGAAGNAIATVGLSDVAATTNSGGVFVTNSTSGNVNITTVTDGVSNTATGITSTTGGNIAVVNNFATGMLTVSQAVTAASTGTVTLTTAGGNLNVNAGVTSASGMIDVNSGAAFTLADGISISSTSGSIDVNTTGTNALTVNGTVMTGSSGTITLDGSDSIAMDSDSVVQSSAGAITIDSANGGAIVDVVSATGGGSIIIAAGSDGTADANDDLTLTDNVTASGGTGSISLYAGDTISVPAVTISAASTGTVLLSAGTDYNEGGSLQNGTAAGNISLADGSTVSSQDGGITLRAPENIQISNVDANSDSDVTLGDVIITADFDGVGAGLSDNTGTITDNTALEGANITGDELALRAGSGIGDGVASNNDDLDADVRLLAAVTESGDIHIENSRAAGLTINTFDGLSGVTITDATVNPDSGNDHITIRSTSPLSVDAGDPVVNNDGGNITLAAEGNTSGDDVDLDANVTAAGGDGSIGIYAGDSINLDAAITVSAVGNGTVLLSASTDFDNGTPQNGLNATVSGEGDVVMQDGSTISSVNGNITLRGDGDVDLATVSTNVDVIVTADFDGVGTGLSDNTGAITDNTAGEGAGNENVTASAAVFSAGGGIGAADDIDTVATSLDVTNTTSGAVDIAETNAVNVLKLDQDATGTTTLTTGGTITVVDSGSGGSGVTATTGTVKLDATGTSSDVVINEDVTTTGGDVDIDAGRNVSSTSGDDITTTGANSGSVDIAANHATAGNVSLAGDIITTGAGTAVDNATADDGGQVDITTVAGTISVTNITTSGGNATGGGTTTGGDAAAITINTGDGSTITLNGDLTAAGGTGTNPGAGAQITLADATVLAIGISVSTGDTAGNVAFQNTLVSEATEANSLNLTAGTGSITFTGAVGSGAAQELGAVTIATANNVTASSTFEAASLTQTAGTGTTTLDGAVTTTAAGTNVDLTTETIDINANVTTNGGTVDLSAVTLVDLATSTSITTTGNAAGEDGGAIDIDVSGTVDLVGSLITTGAANGTGVGGAGGAVTIDTNNGTIAINIITANGGAATADTHNGGDAGDVTIDTGSGNAITLNGDITATGGATVGGNQGAGGDVTVSDATVLGANITIDTGATVGNVLFSSTVNSNATTAQSLDVNAGDGNATFGNDVGTTNALATLDVRTAETVNLGNVDTNGVDGIRVGSTSAVTTINVGGLLDSTDGDAIANGGTAGQILLNSHDINLTASLTIDADDNDATNDGAATLGITAGTSELDATTAGNENIEIRSGNGGLTVHSDFGDNVRLGSVTVTSASGTLLWSGDIATQTGTVGFSGVNGAINVTGTDNDGGTTGSDWIIDTNDNASGNAGNITFGSMATLTATDINLILDATGNANDADVIVTANEGTTVTAASLDVDADQIEVGDINATGGANGFINLNATATTGTAITLGGGTDGVTLDTTTDGTTSGVNAAGPLTIATAGGIVLLDSAAGNTTSLITDGTATNDASITLNAPFEDANNNVSLTLDAGTDGDIDINNTIGAADAIGLLTIDAGNADVDGNTSVSGLRAIVRSSFEIDTPVDTTDDTTDITLDVNNTVSFINAGGLVTADAGSIITSTGGSAAFLLRPLAASDTFGLGDGVTSGGRVSNAFFAAFDGSVGTVEAGFDAGQFDTSSEQTGRITVDDGTAGDGANTEIILAEALTIQADGASGHARRRRHHADDRRRCSHAERGERHHDGLGQHHVEDERSHDHDQR